MIEPGSRTWRQKFAAAVEGIRDGVRGQSSFLVHFPAASIVIAAGFYVRVTPGEWCWLIGCIAVVLAAELFNSALERLAKAITHEANEHLRVALNIASGAVLVVAVGASAIGLLVLGPYVAQACGWTVAP